MVYSLSLDGKLKRVRNSARYFLFCIREASFHHYTPTSGRYFLRETSRKRLETEDRAPIPGTFEVEDQRPSLARACVSRDRSGCLEGPFYLLDGLWPLGAGIRDLGQPHPEVAAPFLP